MLYQVCMNNTEYVDYLAAQTKEVFSNYDADGIFCDTCRYPPDPSCFCEKRLARLESPGGARNDTEAQRHTASSQFIEDAFPLRGVPLARRTESAPRCVFLPPSGEALPLRQGGRDRYVTVPVVLTAQAVVFKGVQGGERASGAKLCYNDGAIRKALPMYVSRTRVSPPVPTLTRVYLGGALLAALFFAPAPSARAVGAWTPLANQAPEAIGTTLLLTDGTVLAQGTSGVNDDGTSAHWFKLTPDAAGSYANATWTRLADMHHERLYYASAVLRNGQVFLAGGEYTEAGYVDTNTAETYDPITDAWTEIAGPPGWDYIGDAPVKTLFDGTILLGDLSSNRTGLYDYTANAWTAGGNTAAGCDEASWALLPDQTVVMLDINRSPLAEKYVPALNAWLDAGQSPVDVVQTSSNEIGPGVLLADGRCLFIGATGHTALYTMPSSPTLPGTWQAGPDFPADGSGTPGALLEAKDAPACFMVNGKVLCLVAPHGDGGDYPNGQRFFEYTPAPNGGAGTLTAAPDAGLDSPDTPAFTGRMLALPSGQVLYSNFNTQLAVYTPDGGPQPLWSPVVSGLTAHTDGSFQVSGTQFNGLSEGAYYGDDASESTNYPLVRLTDGAGAVRYARTFNHSTMGLATGSLPVFTNFTLPPAGSYQLQVVANGIASAPVGLTVPVAPAALTFPTPVACGTVVTATVTLNAVAPMDTGVSLSSSDPSAGSVPQTVLVPAGSSSTTFALGTFRSHVTKTVTIQASLNGVVQATTLTITGR